MSFINRPGGFEIRDWDGPHAQRTVEFVPIEGGAVSSTVTHMGQSVTTIFEAADVVALIDFLTGIGEVS